jgi:hypothetical protein
MATGSSLDWASVAVDGTRGKCQGVEAYKGRQGIGLCHLLAREGMVDSVGSRRTHARQVFDGLSASRAGLRAARRKNTRAGTGEAMTSHS